MHYIQWILYREIKALQESEENHHVVRLHEVFPSGAGFVLVFDYMLSDLSSVLRNCDSPLTEVMQNHCIIKGYGCMLIPKYFCNDIPYGPKI